MTAGEIFGQNAKDKPPFAFLAALEATIRDRLDNPSEDSYVSKLNRRGYPRMLQKIGEEAVEVALAGALDDPGFKGEMADLLFHMMVALQAKNIPLQDIVDVLESRDKPRPASPRPQDAATLTA